MSVITLSFVHATDTSSSIALVERIIKIEDANIATIMPYDAIFESLQDSCSPSTIQTAEDKLARQDIISNLAMSTIEGQTRMFTKIVSTISHMDATSEANCSQKYILYKLLQQIQQQSYPSHTFSNLELVHHITDSLQDNEAGFHYLADYYINYHLQSMVRR